MVLVVILLVDADMKRSAIAKSLKFPFEFGLGELI
jgi:hypothetical protein